MIYTYTHGIAHSYIHSFMHTHIHIYYFTQLKTAAVVLLLSLYLMFMAKLPLPVSIITNLP